MFKCKKCKQELKWLSDSALCDDCNKGCEDCKETDVKVNDQWEDINGVWSTFYSHADGSDKFICKECHLNYEEQEALADIAEKFRDARS
jgi:hypothetical protein